MLPALAGIAVFTLAPLLVPIIGLIAFAIVYFAAKMPLLGGFVLEISEKFFSLASGFLNTLLSSGVVPWSYAKPQDNPILKAGLGQTQPLAIMMWIFAFVICAILIALGIGEYTAKKIIVNLILAGILINFMPFVCGVFIDATNVVAWHFFGDAQGKVNTIQPLTKKDNSYLAKISYSPNFAQLAFYGKQNSTKIILTQDEEFSLTPPGGEEKREKEEEALEPSVPAKVMLNFVIGIGYVIYAVIVLARYAFLWVLVILSPIAIVCWVFPEIKEPGGVFINQLKGFWNWWEGQFFHWCVVGMTLGFFLWLALSSYESLEKSDILKGMGFTRTLFLVTTLAVMLYIGYSLGMQTGAMLGGAIMGGTAALTLGLMKLGTGLAGRAIGERLVSRFAGNATLQNVGQRLSVAGSQAGMAAPTRLGRFGGWVWRGMTAPIRAGGSSLLSFQERLKSQIEQQTEEMAKKSVNELIGEWGKAKTLAQKMQVIGGAIRGGKYEAFRNELQKLGQDMSIFDQQVEKIKEYAKAVSPQTAREILLANPNLVRKETDPKYQWPELMKRIKPEDVKKIPEKFLQSPDVEFMESISDAETLRAAIRRGGKEFVEAYTNWLAQQIKSTQKLAFETLQELKKPQLASELYSSPDLKKLILEYAEDKATRPTP